jgi:ribonucleotide reductase beta subunit family protein with ferritin-like domain
MTASEAVPLSQIESPTESYVARYEWAEKMAIEQQAVFWPAEELGVEEDENDFKINLNPGERHGVLTAQAVISQYELMIGGDEMWGGKIARLFPRPEIQRMCACFANVELGSHAPFYAIGNKVMGNHTDEFYSSWKNDPVLAERIAFINKCGESTDALRVTAALTIMEGFTLFSILAFFKGFNARGFNFIPHFVAGIDGSTKDENFHSLASAQLFKQCKEERIAAGNHTPEQETALRLDIVRMLEDAYAHDLRIIQKMFEIPGNRVVKKDEVIDFMQDRANEMCSRLGLRQMFDRKPGAITGWFYDQLNTVKISDFFATTQLQYRKDWKKHKLIFDRSLLNAY